MSGRGWDQSWDGLAAFHADVYGHAFRKATGATPSAYRRERRE